MILWKQGNFCESNLLWAYCGLSSFFERFFHLSESESCFKQTSTYLEFESTLLKIGFKPSSQYLHNFNSILLAQKCYGNGFFFPCRPPSFWLRRRRRAAAAAEPKSCFDGAENRSARSLWVGDQR